MLKRAVPVVLALGLVVTACAPAASPSPTAAPKTEAKPTEAAKPAEPAKPAAEAKPAADTKPAASPAAQAPPAIPGAVASPAANAPAFNRDALIEGARKEGKLVFYTSAVESQVTTLLKRFNEKYPFVDVSEFYRNTSGRVEAKLQAEIDAGQKVADVFHNANIGTFLALKDKKKLAQFVTPEQDAYAKDVKDPGYWTSWRLTAIIMGYNPTKITEADAPRSWNAFTDPKYGGKIGFEDSTSGTQLTQWYVLRQTMGKDFWQKVGQNGAVAFAGTVPIVEGVLRGELLLAGETYNYHVFNFGETQKAPFKGVYPQEGAPISLAPVAVLEDAPHPNAARLFIDWLLSQEAQTLNVQQNGDYSPRADAPTPGGNPKFSDIKQLYPDSYENLVKSQQEFVDEWNKITKKQG